MPSWFQQTWLAKRPQLDAKLAEKVIIEHVIRGELIGVNQDYGQPKFSAMAIMIVEDILAMSGAVLTGSASRTDVVIADPSATFLPNQFGPGRPAPRAGTRIIRDTWPDSPVFTVLSDPLIDSVGQLVCRLMLLPCEDDS